MWRLGKSKKAAAEAAATLPSTAELRQELFGHLKKGDIAAAESDRYKGVVFDNCIISMDKNVGLDRGKTGYYKDSSKNDKDVFHVEYEDLADLSDWSLLQRKNFYDFQSTCTRQDPQILAPLSYFVHCGSIEAVDFLLKRAAKAQDGQDRADASAFRAPIYFSLQNAPMMEFLLQSGAKATVNVAKAVLDQMKDVTEDSVRTLQLLMSHGVNQKGILDHAKSRMTVQDHEKLVLTLRGVMPAVSAVMTAEAAPAASETAPESFVRFDRRYGDVCLSEVYDFSSRERITFTAQGGVPKIDLRETFNALGRRHDGLQQAIAAYRAKGGTFDEETVFETPQHVTRRIVPSGGV